MIIRQSGSWTWLEEEEKDGDDGNEAEEEDDVDDGEVILIFMVLSCYL